MPNFINSEGVHIHYEVHGDGVPIVFIHPPHMDHHVFNYQKPLRRDYQLIFYDLEGHGASSSQVRPGTVAAYARDLCSLLDHLGLETACIVGYSAGGSIAQQFALEFPHRLRALILSGGFPKVGTWILKKEYELGISIVSCHGQAFLSKVLSRAHQVVKKDSALLFESCMKANRDSVLSFYKDSLHYDCTERLHELRAPLLLLYGSRSYYFHPHIQYYQETVVADFDVVMISNAFHELPMKKHAEFNWLVKAFLKEKLKK